MQDTDDWHGSGSLAERNSIGGKNAEGDVEEMIEWLWLIPTFTIGCLLGAELAYRHANKQCTKTLQELTGFAIKQIRLDRFLFILCLTFAGCDSAGLTGPEPLAPNDPIIETYPTERDGI